MMEYEEKSKIDSAKFHMHVCLFWCRCRDRQKKRATIVEKSLASIFFYIRFPLQHATCDVRICEWKGKHHNVSSRCILSPEIIFQTEFKFIWQGELVQLERNTIKLNASLAIWIYKETDMLHTEKKTHILGCISRVCRFQSGKYIQNQETFFLHEILIPNSLAKLIPKDICNLFS